MTTRPLPDLDLARIATLMDMQQVAELKRIKGGWAPFSYRPVRHWGPDICNIAMMPFGENPETPWEIVEREITKAAKNEPGIDANLGVARALKDFAVAHGVHGHLEEIMPWKVTYWYPAIIYIDDRPTAFFLDPRRGMKLWQPGRRFVFSVMHQRIREAYAEFKDVDLAILQFDVLEDGSRLAKLSRVGDTELYSYEQLVRMIDHTYDLWRAVLEERQQEMRRRGRGGGTFKLL